MGVGLKMRGEWYMGGGHAALRPGSGTDAVSILCQKISPLWSRGKKGSYGATVALQERC